MSGKKSSYTTSTFQCLLQFMFTYLIQSYNQHFKFYLVHHLKKIHKKLHQTDREIILKIPLNNCQSNICVLHLEGPTGNNFNFMVQKVNAFSRESSTCLFLGITLGEMWNGLYSTITEFCPEFDAPRNIIKRRFYTSSNWLWIVLYWYHGYSNITATVTATTTKCKGVNLDVCYLAYSMKNYKSSLYFKRVTQSINLTLIKLGNVVFFSLKEECMVLMVMDWESMDFKYERDFCEIILSPLSDNITITHIDYGLHSTSKIHIASSVQKFSTEYQNNDEVIDEEKLSEFKSITINNQGIKGLEMLHAFKNYKIRGIFFKLHFARRKIDWINMMVQHSKYTNTKYAVTKHSLNVELSPLMLTVHRSVDMFGTDTLLNIDTKMIRYQNVFCDISLQTRIPLHGLSKTIDHIGRFNYKKFLSFVVK